MRPRTIYAALSLVVLAALYFATAKLGLSVAFGTEQVSAVWPCTGLSLAAVILFGPRVWPGIFLGAFLANYTTHEPLGVALGIACGNTLEALAGAWLMRLDSEFEPALGRPLDVVRLVVLAAGAATLISATFGVTSLCLGGVHRWNEFSSLWRLWWLGDAVGAIVAAPLLLVWTERECRPNGLRQYVGGAMLLAALGAAAAAIFARETSSAAHGILWPPLEYLMFPFVIAAGFRFRQVGAATSAFVTASVAILATVNGFGPFSVRAPGSQSFQASLEQLQLFMGVVTVTGLLLGSALAERERMGARLRQSEQQLRYADRQKDEFLAMLAHELRNPLAPIAAASHVLASRPRTDPDVQRLGELIGRQSRHLTRLVDDLLDVARIDSGKIHLIQEPLDLRLIVEQAVEGCGLEIKRRELAVSLDLPPGPLWIRGDRTRLHQVITNLLGNATKFTPPGGSLAVCLRREPTAAALSVIDSGLGIDGDFLPHVFDLFSQGDRGLSRTEGGLGIGLTMAKRLVELHGGRISAQSDGAGRGSRFDVTLPLLPSAAIPDPEAKTAECEREPAPGRPVLIVDDNADAAESLRDLLALWGYSSIVARDGSSAIQAVMEQVPAVGLLDLGLPGLDGLEVARRLRSLSEGMPLVAITGYGQEEDRQRTREAGFDAHLTKPVDPRELEDLLASLPITRARPRMES